jgi:EAL domain-containing protein (putative c-di-GMP-specific phosphodiesterase class I)/CheY-like chemotaxis protein
MSQKILIIDDDADIAELVCSSVQLLGWQCQVTANAVDFLHHLTPDTTLIFLDLMIPGVDGIQLLRQLAEQRCEVGIVLMSGVGKRVLETTEELAASLGLFIAGHLQKPFRLADLKQILSRPTPAAPVPLSPPRNFTTIPASHLRTAIDLDQFVVHYQPLIDIRSGRVTGLEALVRWQHPTRGLIFPDNFIPRIEALGWIDELGWLVATRAFAELYKFADPHGDLPALSLNASVHSLLNLHFPDKLMDLAARFGVPLQKVTIEITESGLLRELSKTLDVLARLRMKNVNISIDDFGTGYSMLQQLRRIPATELKIDKSFVHNMHTSEGDRIIVQKTIEIGQQLGMQVVVEGIETAPQLDFLRHSGCDLAQGYHFSRPLAPANMVTWLKDYRSTPQPNIFHA